jgi:hypothetical protein
MARTSPTAATIIAYNVGFGDCMLLRFTYAGGARKHVLIDFGTTKWPDKFRPKSLTTVANKIADECGGTLDVVVATHRHTDHISGFAGESGKIIASLKPSVVVQPWTEKPNLAVDARGVRPPASTGSSHTTSRQFAAQLNDLHDLADQVRSQVPRLRATSGVPKTLVNQLNFLGETNLKNAEAVKALQAMGKRHVYASFGTDLRLADVLPGVEVQVLGPPTLTMSRDIASMTDTDADEFWHLAARAGGRGRSAAATVGKPIFPHARFGRMAPQEARWLIPKIDRMQADELLSLVRILDAVMNNTSLILLFNVGVTGLLFPGDAQLENWRYALHDAPNSAAIRKRLARTSVYKVGHHGSLNATPRTMLWNNFTRVGAANESERLITILSTASGKHGNEDQATEVPRKRLVTELKTKSRLYNTQDCDEKTSWWRTVDVPLR